MSASPMARAVTSGQDIPTRRVVINNEEDMPSDYSTTPGGTIFGTTPGGTKIVYERAFLINMRNSPLARTPPKNLPSIPGWCSCGKVIIPKSCSAVASLLNIQIDFQFL